MLSARYYAADTTGTVTTATEAQMSPAGAARQLPDATDDFRDNVDVLGAHRDMQSTENNAERPANKWLCGEPLQNGGRLAFQTPIQLRSLTSSFSTCRNSICLRESALMR